MPFTLPAGRYRLQAETNAHLVAETRFETADPAARPIELLLRGEFRFGTKTLQLAVITPAPYDCRHQPPQGEKRRPRLRRLPRAQQADAPPGLRRHPRRRSRARPLPRLRPRPLDHRRPLRTGRRPRPGGGQVAARVKLFCPHCRKPVESLAVVCPACGQSANARALGARVERATPTVDVERAAERAHLVTVALRILGVALLLAGFLAPDTWFAARWILKGAALVLIVASLGIGARGTPRT
jgi:hypothetical protein